MITLLGGNDDAAGRSGSDQLLEDWRNDILHGYDARETYEPIGYTSDGTPIFELPDLSSDDDDLILGEAGNDWLDEDEEADTLYSNTGQDSLWENENADVLYGEADNDGLGVSRTPRIFYWLRALFLLLALSIPLIAEGGTASNREVCSFFSGYRAKPNTPSFKKHNAEHSLGEICVPQYAQVCGKPNIALARLYDMGFPKDDEVLKRLINDTWVIRASEVDIDNDGQNEMRLYITAGTAHCTYSYFFKRTTAGKFQRLVHPSYDVLREEGRFCDGNLAFIRYKGQVFTLEVYDKIDTVWQGSHDELREVCSFWEKSR